MKIAINGIGIAGPTVAYWLRRFGHEPVLFEKAAALRSGGYLIDFWGLGYAVAERMGILANLRARGYEMRWMRMVARDGREEARVDLSPVRKALHGRFISIARSDFARALFEACDGIPARFGVSIAGIERHEAGSVAALSDGTREHFDVIVGADGLHSDVRALAFGPEARFERFLDCYIAAFRVRGYRQRDELTYVSHTMRRRQVARVSLRDDETLVLFVWRPEDTGADAPRCGEEQRAAVRRAFGDMGWETPELLGAMEHAIDFYFDRVSQIHMPRWSAGTVVLLGDAVACPSLLAGEGTGLAMLEAYVLAGELHRANSDTPRAFAAYERRLRRLVTARQDSAAWFRGFFAPETTLGLAVRSLAVHAFGLPFVAKPLVARSLRDDLELPEYAAT
ncbi:MAG TPA: FAD-binding domain [Casimicrobiaceae bacterium]|nr:FAD-binding domain [Casimicrobiaceae bacterium]